MFTYSFLEVFIISNHYYNMHVIFMCIKPILNHQIFSRNLYILLFLYIKYIHILMKKFFYSSWCRKYSKYSINIQKSKLLRFQRQRRFCCWCFLFYKSFTSFKKEDTQDYVHEKRQNIQKGRNIWNCCGLILLLVWILYKFSSLCFEEMFHENSHSHFKRSQQSTLRCYLL